jgi:Ubiquitin family
VKVTVHTARDFVKDLKERAFLKEREEGKNIRLIYQGKVLQDNEMISKYSKCIYE